MRTLSQMDSNCRTNFVTAFEDPGVALPDAIINWVAVRAMPEFMTNLRVACLKLRGGVGNSKLLNPDLFRKEAVKRGISVFEGDSNCNELLEDEISKGDAGYNCAWIDKLLGDSEESEAWSEQTEPSRHPSLQQERTRQGIVIAAQLFYFTYFVIFLHFSRVEIFHNVQT